jgi:hypothetical protein
MSEMDFGFLTADAQLVSYVTTAALSFIAETYPVSVYWDKLQAEAKGWIAAIVALLMPTALWLLDCKAGVSIIGVVCGGESIGELLPLWIIGGFVNWALISEVAHPVINKRLRKK